MSKILPEFNFRALSFREAELVVQRKETPICLTVGESLGCEFQVKLSTNWGLLYDILCTCCDEEWTIEVHSDACVPSNLELPDSIIDAFSDWAKGCRVSYGEGWLSLLPSGKYRLVRSALKHNEGLAQLGNRIFSDINYESLSTHAMVGTIAGYEKNKVPRTDQPLLGIVFDDWGDSGAGVVFVPLVEPVGEGSSTGDLLLVIPMYPGPFIVDVGNTLFPPANDARARSNVVPLAVRLEKFIQSCARSEILQNEPAKSKSNRMNTRSYRS